MDIKARIKGNEMTIQEVTNEEDPQVQYHLVHDPIVKVDKEDINDVEAYRCTCTHCGAIFDMGCTSIQHLYYCPACGINAEL